MDEIGELHWIFDEEYRRVVSNHIVVTLFSIELECETSWISVAVISSTFSGHSWEAKEDRSSLSDSIQEVCSCESKETKKILSYNCGMWLKNYPIWAYLLTSSVTSKYPCAPAPLAWTTLSGIRSRAKWAILSIKLKSYMRRGPLGPDEREFWLLSNGDPFEAVITDCFMIQNV